MKVLLLVNEFRTWYIARHLSYAAQLGIEDGLRANGVDCQIVTTAWLPEVLKVVSKRRFDQVWVAGRLDVIREDSLARLAELAPVRLALLSESTEYTAEECAISPGLRYRKQLIEKRLPYLTHLAACDEKDAADIAVARGIPAVWWPQAVPERFISSEVAPPRRNAAIFCGNPYALRSEYLRNRELEHLLVYVQSSEWTTIDPLLFTIFHLRVLWPLRQALTINEEILASYVARLRPLRRRCFERWLQTLQTGTAVVNLPHFVKTYAGRVVEGMAAGRPIISWEIPERPRNKALFEDGSEVLLFAKENPSQLVDQIKRILNDEALSRKIVQNAQRKLRRFHTSEIRVRQILEWVDDGRMPCYV